MSSCHPRSPFPFSLVLAGPAFATSWSDKHMLSSGLKILQVLSNFGAEAQIEYAYRWERTVYIYRSIVYTCVTGVCRIDMYRQDLFCIFHTCMTILYVNVYRIDIIRQLFIHVHVVRWGKTTSIRKEFIDLPVVRWGNTHVTSIRKESLSCSNPCYQQE